MLVKYMVVPKDQKESEEPEVLGWARWDPLAGMPQGTIQIRDQGWAVFGHLWETPVGPEAQVRTSELLTYEPWLIVWVFDPQNPPLHVVERLRKQAAQQMGGVPGMTARESVATE